MSINIEDVERFGYHHISKVSEKTAEKLKQIHEGKLRGIYTSLQIETTHLSGFYPTDQIVIAGRNGMGKTARVLAMMDDFTDWEINPLWEDKIVVLYDSLEMADWRNMLRLTSKKLSRPIKELLNNYARTLDDEKKRVLNHIYKQFNGRPIFFSQVYPNVAEWEARKSALCEKYPHITFINILDHTRLILKENEKSEEQLITGLMTAGVRIKNKYECINIFLSQMNRNIETSNNRNDLGKNLPINSDIFGSDAVAQTADVIIALHRPGYYGLTNFELGGTMFSTGLSESSNDSLLIECVLKNRDGSQNNMIVGHDISTTNFFDYKIEQI